MSYGNYLVMLLALISKIVAATIAQEKLLPL
jgi:hypothetical protein